VGGLKIYGYLTANKTSNSSRETRLEPLEHRSTHNKVANFAGAQHHNVGGIRQSFTPVALQGRHWGKIAKLGTNLMDGPRPLQIEVLINSPGPHDQVRVREPFLALQKLGVDCRIHERPFRFNSCIRPHSMVIWQRPLPESSQRQWEHLQWLRERGCILLTEWDDHPELFPRAIQAKLESINWAHLRMCHGLHTSSINLAKALEKFQPISVVLENSIAQIPTLDLDKHKSKNIRVFVGNQNRSIEHFQLYGEIKKWLRDNENIHMVVVGDSNLAANLPRGKVEAHPLLSYPSYRKLLSSCHIALMPLERSLPNSCKTPIKLLECAAESVATISGPELYYKQTISGVSVYAKQLSEMIPLAAKLANDLSARLALVRKSHGWAISEMSLKKNLPYRHWIYKSLWKSRLQLDDKLEKCFADSEFAFPKNSFTK